MLSTLLTGLAGVAMLGVFFKVSKWMQNYHDVLDTGFPVFYSPWVFLGETRHCKKLTDAASISRTRGG